METKNNEKNMKDNIKKNIQLDNKQIKKNNSGDEFLPHMKRFTYGLSNIPLLKYDPVYKSTSTSDKATELLDLIKIFYGKQK